MVGDYMQAVDGCSPMVSLARAQIHFRFLFGVWKSRPSNKRIEVDFRRQQSLPFW